MKLPQLAPGAEAGEKAGGGAGGARDHKQQFVRSRLPAAALTAGQVKAALA